MGPIFLEAQCRTDFKKGNVNSTEISQNQSSKFYYIPNISHPKSKSTITLNDFAEVVHNIKQNNIQELKNKKV